MEDWTRSAISERLHREMCQYDENQEPFSEKIRYYIEAIKYATRRVIVKKPSDFHDVFHVYILTFSDDLRDHILGLDEAALNEVINEAAKRIIKARKPDVYRDILQFEPLRWDLINGDGNGRGDGSLIAEHVTIADTPPEESVTITQRLANQIMRQYIFVTTTKDEELFYYDIGKGIYCPDIEWLIKQQCRILHSKIKSYEIEEVIKFIKDSTYIDRSLFDSTPDLLDLQNGVLNIHTLEFTDHSSDFYFLSVIPIDYNAIAQCPTIIKFLRDVLRHEDIGTIFRLIGYCLLRDCRFQRAVMLYGKGANGKGTLLDLVTAFLGIDNCSHRSLQSIDTNRFAIADLYGKMANTYADLKSMKLSETGNFKMAVAGDWVEGEFKFKNAFKFRNKAKLWFSANEIPESEDKSDAFYRRLLIFHFDKQWLYGKEDVDLFKKLTTPEELSGLLNVALVSLSRLVKEGGFHDQTIEEIRRDYEIHTNDVNAFLYEECIVDITNSDYSTLATDAYAAYVNFCVKRNTRPIDMAPFGKRLADKGIYNQRHKIGGQSDHYYDGMILRRSMLHRDQNTL